MLPVFDVVSGVGANRHVKYHPWAAKAITGYHRNTTPISDEIRQYHLLLLATISGGDVGLVEGRRQKKAGCA
jgi:hypothetical protein